MNQDKIRQYNITDAEYPQKLRNIKSPPEKLYVRGVLPDMEKPVVAIVGARNATPYGRRIAREFARVLASNGVQIISGFARGIDRSGHEGALEGNGETFAVLGNGVDICYPKENLDMVNRLLESGGFLSEFPEGTPPRACHFPSRNRIISALADVILVVEAREKSGSLITVDFGLEQGKDIYAVPGRLSDAVSEGCNRLIAQGASIALTPFDILSDLNVDACDFQKIDEKNKIALAKDEETVYSCIRLQPKSMEELMEETGMGLSHLTTLLVRLELKNLIKETGRNYCIR